MNTEIKTKTQSAWPWLFASILIILLDQASKFLVVQNLLPYQSVRLLPFLNVTLKFNPGAAFSFLGNAGGWQVYLLSAFSALVAIILAVWLCRTPRLQRLQACGLSFIIGGAIGNLIDRLRIHLVTDFIDFHLHGWHFATFNLADTAICIGAFLLILKFSFFSD